MRTLALQKLDDFLVIIAFRVMLVKLDDEGDARRLLDESSR